MNKGIMIYLSNEEKYRQLTKDEWYDLSFAAMTYAKTGEITEFNDRYVKSLYDELRMSIDNDYARYQKKAADSAERVRRFREKQDESKTFDLSASNSEDEQVINKVNKCSQNEENEAIKPLPTCACTYDEVFEYKMLDFGYIDTINSIEELRLYWSIVRNHMKSERQKIAICNKCKARKEEILKMGSQVPDVDYGGENYVCVQNRRSVEEAMGNSLWLIKGKSFEEAIKLQTCQNMIEYGDFTEADLKAYCDANYVESMSIDGNIEYTGTTEVDMNEILMYNNLE